MGGRLKHSSSSRRLSGPGTESWNGRRVTASGRGETVGDDDKAAIVEGLGADVVVNYRTDDFVARVLEVTSGAGVELCFDGAGGTTMMKSLRCLGRGGRHLVVGFAGGIDAEEIPMVSGRALCFGNFDILGVILAHVDAAFVP
jgi:NADPH:quinone reductase-like Zn-dependent oxidoreductase